jgi:YHYH protein
MTTHHSAPIAAAPLVLSMLAAWVLAACGANDSASSVSAPGAGTPTGTAGVECNYSTSAFNGAASVNATSTVAWTCNTSSRVMAANGIPDHATGTFPNAGNPHSISAQTPSATYTLSPTTSGTTTVLGGPRGVTGYVLNGIKIDAGTAGTCPASAAATSSCSLIDNSGAWSIEALGQTTFNFGVDSNNAHVHPGGEYHYHGMPEGFITKRSGGPTKMTLVGWAADGFPIYARYGYSVATNASSALKVITGSYRLKTTVATTRPAVSLVPLGAFAQDWEYVAGAGDLDECNGRVGVTPEFPNGIYHYYSTDTYPYFQRCIKGNRS